MSNRVAGMLLSLAGLTICFSLFQNFSLDNEFQDIRKIAPKGVPQEPASPYFPEEIKSTSLNGLGSDLLRHNLSDEMRQLENRFEDWSGIEIRRGAAAVGPATAAATSESSYRLRTGHLGRDKVGIRLESDVNVKCEYSALRHELQLSVDKSFGPNANLSLKHSTEDSNSSLNFSYNW